MTDRRYNKDIFRLILQQKTEPLKDRNSFQRMWGGVIWDYP